MNITSPRKQFTFFGLLACLLIIFYGGNIQAQDIQGGARGTSPKPTTKKVLKKSTAPGSKKPIDPKGVHYVANLGLSFYVGQTPLSEPGEIFIVRSVDRSSPAAIGGLKKDDEIISVNGIEFQERTTYADGTEVIDYYPSGSGKLTIATLLKAIQLSGSGSVNMEVNRLDIRKTEYGNVEIRVTKLELTIR